MLPGQDSEKILRAKGDTRNGKPLSYGVSTLPSDSLSTQHQVLGPLFDYLPKRFDVAQLTIEQIRAFNHAHEFYIKDQEGLFSTRCLRLLSFPVSAYIHEYCLRWIKMYAEGLRHQNVFSTALRMLIVAQLSKLPVHDSDYERILNRKSLYIDRNRLVKLYLLERVPGSKKTRITAKGRKLIKLVMEAIEVCENNMFLAINETKGGVSG